MKKVETLCKMQESTKSRGRRFPHQGAGTQGERGEEQPSSAPGFEGAGVAPSTQGTDAAGG